LTGVIEFHFALSARLASLLLASVCLGVPANLPGGLSNTFSSVGGNRAKPVIAVTLIPPSPISERTMLDIRAGFRNDRGTTLSCEAEIFLDQESPSNRICKESLDLPSNSARAIRCRWPAAGKAGKHEVVVRAVIGGEVQTVSAPVLVLPSGAPSTRRLGGAWVDLYHHSEDEGRPFNEELARMTDAQWRELVRAMHETDQNLVVITMMFQNYAHRGKHRIEAEGYQGRAYYPSRLYPRRMPIASSDPLEAILSEADRLGMSVMPGVGLYAFSDYGPGSLAWHKDVAAELWARYGHHRSFYGWYISEEKWGSLGTPAEQEEMVSFFREFAAYARGLAPEKPVMLAPNCFSLRKGTEAYRKLLPHLDILCPFGFHRMPATDMTGEEAAALLQSWCDQAGTHLWMDLESFEFRHGKELHPRPIAGLIEDLTRFPNFEKTLHYQFPGMMSSPAMSRQPGGTNSVKLYLDYKKFLSQSVLGSSR
jgi:hypothetical protein